MLLMLLLDLRHSAKNITSSRGAQLRLPLDLQLRLDLKQRGRYLLRGEEKAHAQGSLWVEFGSNFDGVVCVVGVVGEDFLYRFAYSSRKTP